ncbi:unnamed protein product, partial [Pelagomonas calceolata]
LPGFDGVRIPTARRRRGGAGATAAPGGRRAQRSARALQQLHARDLHPPQELAGEDLRRAAVAEGLRRAAEGVLLGAVERGCPRHVCRGADGVQGICVERADGGHEARRIADDAAERLVRRVQRLRTGHGQSERLRRIAALPRQYARSVVRHRGRLFSQLCGDGFGIPREDLAAVATPHQDLLAADRARLDAPQAARGVDDGRVGGALVEDGRRVRRRLRGGGIAEREGQEGSDGRRRTAEELYVDVADPRRLGILLTLRSHVKRAVRPRDAHREAHGRRGRRRPVERGLLRRKDCGGLARALRALRRRRHHGGRRLAEPLAARRRKGFVGALRRDVEEPVGRRDGWRRQGCS